MCGNVYRNRLVYSFTEEIMMQCIPFIALVYFLRPKCNNTRSERPLSMQDGIAILTYL